MMNENENQAAVAETEIDPSRLAGGNEAYAVPANHVFRKKYRALNPEEAIKMDALKDAAFEVHKIVENIPKSRETSLALTNLEQAVMWAVKAITA